MKKYLLLIIITSFVVYSCKKKENTVSKLVTVSYPTFAYPNGQFFSIPIGGPMPTVTVTAYDSVLKESLSAGDTGTVDNTTPGLYVLVASAKNSNGYSSISAAFIAVTDISPSIDLSGLYVRYETQDTFSIEKVANGLYRTNDVGGAPQLPIVAYFAQLDDTTLTLPPQPTDAGTLSATNAKVSMAPGDTTITWEVVNSSFGTQARTFYKL